MLYPLRRHRPPTTPGPCTPHRELGADAPGPNAGAQQASGGDPDAHPVAALLHQAPQLQRGLDAAHGVVLVRVTRKAERADADVALLVTAELRTVRVVVDGQGAVCMEVSMQLDNVSTGM